MDSPVESKKHRDKGLAKALQEIPDQYKCFQLFSSHASQPKGLMLLGVKESNSSERRQLSILPERAKGFKFYIGSTHLNVFKAFVRSSFPADIEELFIGYSTDNYKKTECGINDILDYTEIVNILSETHFPKLRKLSLGITEQFCNGEVPYGAMGDVSTLFQNMPNIEEIHLGGYFEMSCPIELKHLKVLQVSARGDWELAINQPISKESQINLFSSTFPKLEKLCALLECYGAFEYQVAYTFPSSFLSLQNMPALKEIELSGLYKKGEREALRGGKLWRQAQGVCEITDYEILAIDVHYQNDHAFVAGITFSCVDQKEPTGIYYSELEVPAIYQSGEFYKRELPCITRLLDENALYSHVIIVDGYAYLDNQRKKGLGAHLAWELYRRNSDTIVIGVAKNPRKSVPSAWEVYRGSSTKPLYVDSIGMDSKFAREFISKMAGENRVPILLKLVDRLCRDKGAQLTKLNKI